MSRGQINCNPGNIRKTSDKWQGLNPDQSSDKDFFVFSAPKWGIRAMARILIEYQDRTDTNTISIEQIVKVWAPSVENNVQAYEQDVSQRSNIGITEQVNINEYSNMYKILTAMIYHENGMQPYSTDIINEGIRLAGISPPVASLTRNPVAIVSTITAAAGTLSPVIQSVGDTASTLSPALHGVLHYAPWLFGVAMVCGTVYLIVHELIKNKVVA